MHARGPRTPILAWATPAEPEGDLEREGGGTDAVATDRRPWQLRLLGRLAVRQGDATVRTPAPRTQPLVALLALHPEGVTREDLAGTLFPSEHPASRRRHVSQLLFALRRTVPELPVSAEGALVRLPRHARSVDAEDIARADPSIRLDVAARVLDAVDGPLLTGLDPDAVPAGDWLRSERRRWDDRVRTLARATVRHLLVSGRDDEAITLLRRIVEQHPHAEGEALRLAELLAARGDRADALAVLDTLAAELDAAGLEPNPDASAARARIAAGTMPAPTAHLPDPAARPADAVAARAQAGDFATAARLLRDLEARNADAPAERRLAAAQLAIAREEEHRAEALLAGADAADPRVWTVLAAAARARHDPSAATARASAALLATDDGDRVDDRVDALTELTRVRSRAGQGRRALESAAAAVELVRAHGDPPRLVRALLARGAELRRQGRRAEARRELTEARTLAEAHEQRLDHATALHHLGTIASLDGALLRARALQEREVGLRRDLALDRSEAMALSGLATTRLKLGDHAAARAESQLAGELADRAGDPLARARTRLCWALALHCDPHARTRDPLALVEEGLQIHGEGIVEPTWIEGALGLLRGVLCGEAGDPLAGLASCDEALAIFESREEPEMIPRVTAARALLLLALDRPDDALVASRHALQSVLEGTAEGDHLATLSHVHARALRATGHDAEARRFLERALRHLRDLVSLTDDPALRARLLARDPATRALVADLRAAGLTGTGGWLDDQPADGVAAAGVGSDGGGESDGGDESDGGGGGGSVSRSRHAVFTRRAELARILDRADEAGLRPHVAELARRLGVSTRTIKRDLAALRSDRAARPIPGAARPTPGAARPTPGAARPIPGAALPSRERPG